MRARQPWAMRDIREEFISYILRFVIVFGFFALLGSLARAAQTGWRSIMAIHVGAYLFVLCLAALRRRMSYFFRSWLLLGLVFVLAAAGLIHWGLSGMGLMMLTTFLACVTILWGTTAGIIAAGACVLLVASVGWGASSGFIVFDFDAQAALTTSSTWLNAVSASFFFFGIMVGCIGYVNKRLLSLTNDYRQRYFDLADVHDRLEKSEDLYRTMFNTAKDGLFIIKNRRFIDANPRGLEMLDCSRQDLINTSPADWSPEFQPDGRFSADVAENLLEAAGGGRNQLFEWRHQRRDGTMFDAEATLVRLPMAGDVRMLATVRDISDRKRTEAALRQSEENYRLINARQSLIFDCLPMAFYCATMDAPFGRTWVGGKINRLTGFPVEKFIGENDLWPSRIHPDDRPVVEGAFYNRDAHASVFVEYRWRHVDASYHWFLDHATIVPDNHGELREVIGICLDITDKKKAEEQRDKMEQQLLQSQKMEAIGTLTGGIAHDFNNILFPMIGYLEMILKSLAADDRLYKKVSRVLEGARRAGDLTRQILSISHRAKEDERRVNIGLVVNEAADLSRSSLPSSIAIRTDIDMDTAEVLASPSHIHQIVMNLITNAYHAMQETGGVLVIGLKSVHLDSDTAASLKLKSGDCVVLSVSDSGAGMTPEVLGRVFDPYFTTKGPGRGTGLGLFVVQGLVKKYGGSVAVRSEPDRGTDFKVYLPVCRVGEPAATRQPAEAVAIGGNESILVVDDEETILLMIRDYLAAYGYKVMTQTSGLAALEMIQAGAAGKVDVMITDMVMPQMSGLELAERVHALYPRLPVLLMTGYSQEISGEQMSRAGISEVLFKPVSPKIFVAAIRKIMDDRPADNA